MIFTNKATRAKTTKAGKPGRIYAPGKTEKGYAVFVISENYCGHVRGGIRKSWCVVQDGMTLDASKALLNKRLGYHAFN